MPKQAARPVKVSTENNFVGGLKTEFTALNFPENACTDTSNCIFTLVGSVIRRKGFDFELNHTDIPISGGQAISSYRWLNAGGDGNTQILALQVGPLLHFFKSSDATVTTPLSGTHMATVLDLSSFATSDGMKITEFQYTDGDGHLFVFSPHMDPVYLTYLNGVITATRITVKIRDFEGIPETAVPDSFRSTSLSDIHNYNLINAGWVGSNATARYWSSTLTGQIDTNASTLTLTVAAGMNVTIADSANIHGFFLGGSSFTEAVTVSSYSGTTMVVNVPSPLVQGMGYVSTIEMVASSATSTRISSFFTALSVYPSNSDVWWLFKDSSGVFNPSVTAPNVTVNAGPAPRGFLIFDAFNQTRAELSGVAAIQKISTDIRPRTGAFYEGRLWFAGTDAATSTSQVPYYSWTENIYFSQVIVNDTEFGNCYQVNDPTSEDRFDLLPTDGGVIHIQGMGSVYKLFPMQSGLLVFAANGIWFIGGSANAGFSANDYSISKLAAIRSISGTSFVNVNGFPMFWNEEGIYFVSPSEKGGSIRTPDIALDVRNLVMGTIQTFYRNIPLTSKKFARGDYDPINFVVQWTYRDTQEDPTAIDRYNMNQLLNFNTAKQSFYPWSISASPDVPVTIAGVNYIVNPGGSDAPDPIFKYIVRTGTGNFTFAEERDDTNYQDWASSTFGPIDYTSFFETGYKLHGEVTRRFQTTYIHVYNELPIDVSLDVGYIFQGVWDFSRSGDSGKKNTTTEFINLSSLTNPTLPVNFGVVRRRHKLRGSGYSVQYKISSVTGLPFFVIGWSAWETQHASV